MIIPVPLLACPAKRPSGNKAPKLYLCFLKGSEGSFSEGKASSMSLQYAFGVRMMLLLPGLNPSRHGWWPLTADSAFCPQTSKKEQNQDMHVRGLGISSYLTRSPLKRE